MDNYQMIYISQLFIKLSIILNLSRSIFIIFIDTTKIGFMQ